MGKIEAEASINHFSHPHPLNLVSIQSSTSNKTTCSACKKQASGLTYTCKSCEYCLHKSCSNMPQFLTHQSDPKHALTLLPSPAYSFRCNACGASGTGFCYHCKECQLDLHPVCAFMPQTVKGGAHDHPLKICYEPPYENKAFICDVCGGSGLNHWLYRCDPCEFDAHLKCARASSVQHNRQPRMDKKPQIHKSRSAHFPAASNWSHQQGPLVGMPVGSQSMNELHRYGTAPVYATASFAPQPTRNDRVQDVVHNLIEGIIEGAGNQIGQLLMQGALGNS